MPPKKPLAKKSVTKSGTAKKAPIKKKSTESKKEKPEVIEVKEPLPEKPVIPMARNIKLKDMAKVLFEDESLNGKPILLVEAAGTSLASTFLRYRDVNFLSVLNSNEMEKERIRKAILGALRFGKPVVFDMEDANLFDQINTFIDNVQPGLYHSLLDGSVTKEENIQKLIHETDEPEYEYRGVNLSYYEQHAAIFKFIVYIRKEPDDEKSVKFTRVNVSN